MEKNLTTGSVFKNIVFFSLPYLLSYFLQTLYGMADLYIIGRFNGVEHITAVTIGSQVMHMITVMIVGLAMGSTVIIGRSVGAGDREKTASAIGNTVNIFFAVSILLTVLLVINVRGITGLISTPDKAVDSTIAYLTICFLGIPFITAYNVISSVFRGLGDSKSPMYFIAIACVVNIVLDCILVGAFGMGPAGAALATVIAQTVSVVTAFFSIIKQKTGITLRRKDFKINLGVIRSMLGVGIPVALQDGFIQIAFILITVIANRRGLNDAAAVGIVEKIISIIFLIPSTMLSTVSALASQNIGAGYKDRAALALKYAIVISVCYGIAVTAVIQFAAGDAVGLFSSDTEVIRLGSQYLKGYVADCIFAGVHFCFSGYFCACEKSGISFLHNVCSIVFMRVPGAYIASQMFADTLFPMGLAAPAGSLLSVVICIAAYIIIGIKDKKTVYN